MFKIKIVMVAAFSVLFMSLHASAGADKFTIETAFSEMLKSSDYSTKVTAIVMIADFKETALANDLVKLLKKASGIERCAVLYSLSILQREEYLDAFIDSVPTDEKSIKELLDIESPRGSYFKAPYLRIINYLGYIAIHNDKAFSRLKAIDLYADGWQGDSVMELIIAAEKLRIDKN